MLTALSTISKAFFDICLLRKGPEDLPKSSVLLVLSLFIYTFIDVLLTVQSRPFEYALMVSLVDVGFLLLVTSLILKQHQKLDRWYQTMTALFGTGVILGIFIFPLVIFSGVQNEYEAWLQQINIILFLIIVVWNVAVLAHIIRHAISTSRGIATMIAVLYILMSSLLITMLFPEISSQMSTQ
jgi:cytochrome bd-type quinol oxidase subunit 2